MEEKIVIRGARQHNLKHIDVDIPINSFTVITGLSGSGKSSLAFDTLYAEGQRRYVESLSAYARQFLGVMQKPDVDSIKGLSPAIAIQQKQLSHNPRSTVGTVTEIYDYLRLLYARIGTPHCPKCGEVIKKQDPQSITNLILSRFVGSRVQILAPIIRARKGTYDHLFSDLKKQGFTRVRVDGLLYNLGKESILLKRYVKHTIEAVIDRLEVSAVEKQRIQEAVETALARGSDTCLILVEKKDAGTKKWEEVLMSRHLACPACGISMHELEPRMFSFNSPQGACETCHGLGVILEFDEFLMIPDRSKSLHEGGVAPLRTGTAWFGQSTIEALGETYGFSLDVPLNDLASDVVDLLLHGSEDGSFEGIRTQLERHYRETQSDERRADIARYMREHQCHACKGKRLKKASLCVTVGDRSIIDVTDVSLRECDLFFKTLALSEMQKKIAEHVIREVRSRLSFLVHVGLEYLSLSRNAGTLSGGEAQRIHLATQIGTELRGVLYILDEPSIGLHQRDNKRLIETLKRLRDLGNTVIVVEHDEETMRSADYLIDIGPGAGINGGEVVYSGAPEGIGKAKQSITGHYLSGKKKILVPATRRPARGWLQLFGASGNNLKKIDVKFPLGVLCCVTGISGSGKSTLVNETLFRILANHLYGFSEVPGSFTRIDGLSYLDKAVIIDQQPIGRTPRSNPATYSGVFTYMRELFSQTREARVRGYQPGRFSFNVSEGRCGTCEGDGLIKIEMHFLPDVYVPCESCGGKRYDEETLSVLYKEKTIADVLAMTAEEALQFFTNIPRIKSKLQTLVDVGLGYIELGQSAPTLSGGEAQRMKLATELSRRDTGRTAYFLDEPTTGLHFDDIQKLLGVLNRLVDKGNTVCVIEHNLDVIKTADYIIDLGPEGGDAGGEVVACGTPEQLARCEKSVTGEYLKKSVK